MNIDRYLREEDSHVGTSRITKSKKLKMNERIKQLLIQSEVFNKDDTVLKDVTGYELNKFAELIVAECARVVDIWSDEVPFSEGYDKFTVSKLKEHFGVEE